MYSYVGNDITSAARYTFSVMYVQQIKLVVQWNYYARQFIQISDRARKNLRGDASTSLTAVDLPFPIIASNDDEMLSECGYAVWMH